MLLISYKSMASSEGITIHDGQYSPSEVGENDLNQQSCFDSQFDEPKMGMIFQSEDDAYYFYNTYARKKGFSVRKDRMNRRPDGSISSRKFVCSHAGTRAKNHVHETKNPHVNQRTECKCRIDLRVSKEGIWEIYNVNIDHNHPMVSPNKTFMLRSHRKILPSTLNVIEQLDKAGIPPSKAYEFFKEGSVGSQNVGFMRSDHNNLLYSQIRKSFNRNDAQSLLDHFKQKQLMDPAFYYAIQLSEEGYVSNVFWADGKSLVDYSFFGDVICFDTTFKTNKYDLPFAPLLGVNNHKQTVIFGAALLNDETTESFIWLFETFMKVVGSNQPKTIFTDRCDAMAKAISIVFPSTAHRLCLWHIFENAAKHLSHVFASNPSFASDFRRCIYEARSSELLVMAWEQMLRTYNLESNEWLKDLWGLRQKWSAFYRSGSFCANMTTTQRSESMNNHFKKHLGKKLSFARFIEEYDNSLDRLREKELYEDHKSKNFTPIIRVPKNQMLKDAANAYTRSIYLEFEEECLNQISCFCELVSTDGDLHIFKIFPQEEFNTALVTFNVKKASVECSCNKFESVGILCMHAIKVLAQNRIISLSPKYILKRWTKFAKDGFPYPTDLHNPSFDISLQYKRVSTNALALVKKCCLSKHALDLLEREFDSLTIQVDTIICHNDKGKNSVESYSGKESSIAIKPPPTKVSGQPRRFKSALERAVKKKRKQHTKPTSTSASQQQPTQQELMIQPYGFMGLLNQVSQELQPLSRQLFF